MSCINFHHVTYFDIKNERRTSARIIIFDGASMVCIESIDI